MRSKKKNTKNKQTKRFYKKGGDTSSDMYRMEEGLGPRKDVYAIEIKPTPSSYSSYSARSPSSSIPPPPPLLSSSSIKELLTPPQKNSKKIFPYERVDVDPYDIESMVQDLRPFPPKATPIQFEVSPPLTKRRVPFNLSFNNTDAPFRLTKSLPDVLVVRDAKVQNQNFNPFKSWSAEEERPPDLAFGYRVKTMRKRRHNKKTRKTRKIRKHSKKYNRKHSKKHNKRRHKK